MFSYEMHLNFPPQYAFPRIGARKKNSLHTALKHKFGVGVLKWAPFKADKYIRRARKEKRSGGEVETTDYYTCGPRDSIVKVIPLIG